MDDEGTRRGRKAAMKGISPTICSLFVAALAGAAKAQSVKPPFPVSLHANRWLGTNPNPYRARIDGESATYTRLVFEMRHRKAPNVSISFVVPGVLADFKTVHTNLVLTFKNPGPATGAYSEVEGKVRQIFKCNSRLGADSAPVDTPYGGVLVCYQG